MPTASPRATPRPRGRSSAGCCACWRSTAQRSRWRCRSSAAPCPCTSSPTCWGSPACGFPPRTATTSNTTSTSTTCCDTSIVRPGFTPRSCRRARCSGRALVPPPHPDDREDDRRERQRQREEGAVPAVRLELALAVGALRRDLSVVQGEQVAALHLEAGRPARRPGGEPLDHRELGMRGMADLVPADIGNAMEHLLEELAHRRL